MSGTVFQFPSHPIPGQVVVGVNGATWIWDGTKWVGGMGGPYLPLAGGTMDGPLYLEGPEVDGNLAASRDWVSHHAIWPDAPFDGQAFGRHLGGWTPVLPITGGVMRGPINMHFHRLEGVPWPVNNHDAVPKEYVDQQIAEIGPFIVYQAQPPPNPPHKLLWATPSGELFIYDAEHLHVWIQIAGPSIGGGGPGGEYAIAYQATPPLNPVHAMLWATPSGELFIFDAGLNVWIQIAGPSFGGGGGAFPEAPATGDIYGRNGLTESWEVIPLLTGVDGGTW